MERGRRKVKHRVPLKALARVASVAAGVQFGWALQLSLLTPYVQELGIPHQYASLIWLCGPISGMFVQPIIGHYSDQCTSSYGRRRPFILIGAILVVCSVLTIGYSADIGYLIGDDLSQAIRPRAIIIFVIGFWLLDLANNTLQGPCRALLADYTGTIPSIPSDRFVSMTHASVLSIGRLCSSLARSGPLLICLKPNVTGLVHSYSITIFEGLTALSFGNVDEDSACTFYWKLGFVYRILSVAWLKRSLMTSLRIPRDLNVGFGDFVIVCLFDSFANCDRVVLHPIYATALWGWNLFDAVKIRAFLFILFLCACIASGKRRDELGSFYPVLVVK